MSDAIVIVGSGLAGYGVARELRKLNSEIPILMLSLDHGGFYSKPMLSNALSTGKTPESLLSGDASRMASQMNISIRPFTRVVTIEQVGQIVILEDGEKIRYHHLVLAIGADQIHLPLSGNATDKIMTINNLDDYKIFRTELTGKQRISIIGAGLIGCEFANDLASAGYHVDVIDISAQPLGRLLPPAAGEFMRQKLGLAGVTFHLNASTQTVDQTQSGFCITFSDGKSLKTDLILSSIGLRPRIQLPASSGIAVNRGIVVNRLLQTQSPHIYAIGDCAEVDGKVLPFVMPITHAARALAATLNGHPTPVQYPAMPVLVKTPACPTVVSPPDFSVHGEWRIERDTEGIKALYQNDAGDILGFALLGVATKEKNSLTPQLPPILK
ncbi:MAG: FAD-dependent oxidoreductase [Nitrosomonas sp.]|nr:MAG: FAD-dependent oxidoreductase [Nitrosomonas sp.]